MLSARGLAVQVGYQAFDAGQLRRYRAAVDGAAGEELDEVLAALHRDGLVPDGVPALAGRPRGCPRGPPAAAAAAAARACTSTARGRRASGSRTGEALERVRAAWRAARPLADWLDGARRAAEQVGAPRRPPDAARRTTEAPQRSKAVIHRWSDAHRSSPGTAPVAGAQPIMGGRTANSHPASTACAP